MPLNRDRLSRLTVAEAMWRGRTAAADTVDRIRTRLAAPRWRREDLRRALASRPELTTIGAALADGRWRDAHRALSSHFHYGAGRFVIAPSMRPSLVSRITERFPDSAARARRRADRVLEGKYDLLGYRDLQFEGPDWHFDPVHRKRPPLVFWSKVPYLDATCGDHKILWELNRHQHWMVLGRAYWLTGDPRYRAACLVQLESWLDANPPLIGVNWASMLELAFRSLSWVWALNFFADAAIDDETPWLVDLLVGLDRQLTHIEGHLSHYFSPNTHLIGEALALYVSARALPELKASPRREEVGRRVLLAEARRQIAGDGGHTERSTHYHRYTLDFYLLALAVARRTQDPAAHGFHDAALRLASAARLLADDRGKLPHLGDDDGGALLPLTGRPLDDIRDSLAIAAALSGRSELAVGPPPEEMWWVLGAPRLASLIPAAPHTVPTVRLRSAALPETGYYVSRSTTGDHLVIDGGPHGYLNGGHAHADALSLTFTRRSQPLLIDPGTGCYTVNPTVRDRFRSTDLHNTLSLDRRSQSTPAGPFGWSQAANAVVHCWRTNDHFDYFDGSHDGYAPTIHRRHVFVLHDDAIVVADCVLGSGVHRATVHWHLDPAWSTRMNDRSAALFSGMDVVELAVPYGQVERAYGNTATGLGWHSPVYGRIEPATTLRIARQGPAPLWIVSVFGLDLRNSIRAVQPMNVCGPPGALGHPIGLRLERSTSIDHLLIAEPFDEAQRRVWTMGEIATDARMLFLRFDALRYVTSVALVDGTTVRAGHGSPLALTYPSRVPDLHLHHTLPKGVFSCAALLDS